MFEHVRCIRYTLMVRFQSNLQNRLFYLKFSCVWYHLVRLADLGSIMAKFWLWLKNNMQVKYTFDRVKFSMIYLNKHGTNIHKLIICLIVRYLMILHKLVSVINIKHHYYFTAKFIHFYKEKCNNLFSALN